MSYDDKPLLLFQKLKDRKKNPVFMLKHIKDIHSPIVVAQQRHAARKALGEKSSKIHSTENNGLRHSQAVSEAKISVEESFAVAIYPYMAEQDDEFDVTVYVLVSCLLITPMTLLTPLKFATEETCSLFRLERKGGGLCSETLSALVPPWVWTWKRVGSLRDAYWKPKFQSLSLLKQPMLPELHQTDCTLARSP